MNIRWFGTATLVFSCGGSSILFDPFLPLNSAIPSPSIQELSVVGDIFITHGHFDHLMHVPSILKAGNSMVYCCAAAAESLLRDGVARERIAIIKPGDRINKGPFEITVYRGKHIRFDLVLVGRTLFSYRSLKNFQKLKRLLQLAKRYPEGQVLVYQITTGKKTVLNLGSLNLEASEDYPTGADLLTMPFQGRSDLNRYALTFIEQLKPKALYLHHFDDTFPPVSNTVDTESFTRIVNSEFPRLPVIVPEYKAEISI